METKEEYRPRPDKKSKLNLLTVYGRLNALFHNGIQIGNKWNM